MPATSPPPSPAAVDERRQGRAGDGEHESGADACEDHRDGEGKLDAAEDRQLRHAHASGGLDERRVDPFEPDDSVAQHRQRRVDDQRRHRGDETGADPQSEQHHQSDGRDRLTEIAEREAGRPDPPGAPPRQHDAEGECDEDGDQGRDQRELDVVEQLRGDLLAVEVTLLDGVDRLRAHDEVERHQHEGEHDRPHDQSAPVHAQPSGDRRGRPGRDVGLGFRLGSMVRGSPFGAKCGHDARQVEHPERVPGVGLGHQDGVAALAQHGFQPIPQRAVDRYHGQVARGLGHSAKVGVAQPPSGRAA